MVTILLTSFEPFDGADTNPSEAVVNGVALRRPEARTLRLPVSFKRAGSALLGACETLRPSVIVSVGLAANRSKVSMERLAVNLADARIPDNDGDQPGGVELVPGGPVAKWTSLPVKTVLRTLDPATVELSMSAGTYVCNAVFYHALTWADGAGARAGFVHVPLCETEADVTAGVNTVDALITATLSGGIDAADPVGLVS